MECGKRGEWKTRSVENSECRKRGVWKMRSVENAECGKCGVFLSCIQYLSLQVVTRYTEITITKKPKRFYLICIELEQLLQLKTINLYIAIPMKYRDII